MPAVQAWLYNIHSAYKTYLLILGSSSIFACSPSIVQFHSPSLSFAASALTLLLHLDLRGRPLLPGVALLRALFALGSPPSPFLRFRPFEALPAMLLLRDRPPSSTSSGVSYPPLARAPSSSSPSSSTFNSLSTERSSAN